jgi:hypothetical protein
MEAKAGHLAVAVEADEQHRLAGLEFQPDVDHGAVAGRDRVHLARALVAAEHADHLRPSAGEAVNVVALAHEVVEVTKHFFPPAGGEAGEELGCPLDRAWRDGAGHRLAGAGIDRVPEPLERGLPAGAEHVTDIPPALPGGPGTVNGRLHGCLGGGRQVPCRRHGVRRRGAAGELPDKAACRVGDPERNRVVRAGHAVHAVKVSMTVIGCQLFLYSQRSAASRARPQAAGRVPAPGVAIPAFTPPALLGREGAPARLARSRLGNIRHDSP